MQRFTAGTVFVAAALISTAAAAADLRPAPVLSPGPIASWTGYNFGGGIGTRSNVDDGTITGATLGGAPVVTGPVVPPSFNDTTFRGALFLGYDYQVNANWVIGIEGDVGIADNTVTQPLVFGGPADRASIKETWDASLRARFGYILTPTMLPYMTVGVAWMKQEGSVNCAGVAFSACATANSTTVDDTLTGWTIGGGFDVKFAQNWFARAEYRYTDYGSTTRAQSILLAPAPGGVFTASGNQSTTTHTTLFGVYYKF